MSMTVDVIIPVFMPDERLLTIIEKLRSQSVKPGRITVMNTGKSHWEEFIKGREEKVSALDLQLRHVDNIEFDHGRTRNEGAEGSAARFLLFMTQDAIPADDKLIERLVCAFDNPDVGAAYARQTVTEDAPLSEKFSRTFNYPEESLVKSSADIERLGIKTFFCSNACAMYDREVYEKLGRFPVDMIFNEDMVFARRLIESGKKIYYVADAKVIHFHNYTNKRQFKRNFDLAVSQAMHPEAFSGVSSESEGVRYAMKAFSYFVKQGKPLYFIPFAITCACRLVGYKLGKNYMKLSRKLVLKCTDSPYYFERLWGVNLCQK